MKYERLVQDYEMKNGKLDNDNIEVMYNSIDNSIAYNHDNDTYIINKEVIDNGKEVYNVIYDILESEINLLGKEHFMQLINPYGSFVEFWIEELGI